MMYNNLKNLTKKDKLEYLSKYLTRYIDAVISKFTNSKKLVENVINDNTLMHLIVEMIDYEEAKQHNILIELQAPFENKFITYNDSAKINHILYDLIIKD